MKRTKTKLVSSIVTLLICFAMLIGSTFAWFTDSASTDVNTIQSGNLDIELEYYDSSSSTWKAVTDSTKLFDDSALWEPGHTEVAYLHIKNAGSLDLKYKMNVNVPSETGSINQKGAAFKLSDFLVFGKVLMDDKDDIYTNDATGRAAARSEAGTTMGLSSWTKAGNLYANPIPATVPEGSVSEEYVALVIYMPETVGNEANYKKGATVPNIQLGVNIVATQLNSESDSFGNDYDANADGNPDNGAAWTMAAFRAEAVVPNDVSTAGMSITKYENDTTEQTVDNLLAKVTIPATTATFAGLSTTDKVVLSIDPTKPVPAGIQLSEDEVALNFDVKLTKIGSNNNETTIASTGHPVTVELKVGPGYSGVKLYHTSEGGTPELINNVTYDPVTGIAKYEATSFSDYTAVYNAKLTSTLPANAKLVMTLEELETALKNLHDGDYIAFGANIVQDKVDTTSGQITFTKSSEETGAVTATLDLNGYVFDGQIGGFSFANDDLTMIIHGTDKAVADYYEHETGHHIVKACAIFLYSGIYNIKDGLFKSNNATIFSYGGAITIDGGEFVQTSNGVVIGACNDGKTIINDGVFTEEGEEGALFALETYRDNSYPVLVINDGTFTTKGDDSYCFIIEEGNGPKCEVVINGGTFNLTNINGLACYSEKSSTTKTADELNEMLKNSISIKGGTFNVDPTPYVADGYHAVKNSNGTWTVVAQ